MTFLTHKFDIYVLCKLYSYPLKRQGMTIKIWKSTFKNFKVILFNQLEGSEDIRQKYH